MVEEGEGRVLVLESLRGILVVWFWLVLRGGCNARLWMVSVLVLWYLEAMECPSLT